MSLTRYRTRKSPATDEIAGLHIRLAANLQDEHRSPSIVAVPAIESTCEPSGAAIERGVC